jgi:hypothetical protein
MAVGAHEDALPRLLAKSGQRPALRRADRKRLARRVDVVEVQADDAAVVAADGATPPGFLDELAPDLLVAAGNRLADATLAAPAKAPLPRAVSMEFDDPVASASPEFGRAGLGWRPPGITQKRRRGKRSRHEHMFPTVPDRSAVSDLAIHSW